MEALRKITLMPAQRLERRAPALRATRGGSGPGADADLTVFDPARVRDRATWSVAGGAAGGDRLRDRRGRARGRARGAAERRQRRAARPSGRRSPADGPCRIRATGDRPGTPPPPAAGPTAARSSGPARPTSPAHDGDQPGGGAREEGQRHPRITRASGTGAALSGCRRRSTITAATANSRADHSTTTKYVVRASKSRSRATSTHRHRGLDQDRGVRRRPSRVDAARGTRRSARRGPARRRRAAWRGCCRSGPRTRCTGWRRR